MNEQVSVDVSASVPIHALQVEKIKIEEENKQSIVEKFIHWSDNAKPGDVYSYYEGYNLSDSILGREIRKVTYRFSVMGEVYLVQSRRRDRLGVFIWHAIKASKPPVYRLLPFSEEQIKQLSKIRGN